MFKTSKSAKKEKITKSRHSLVWFYSGSMGVVLCAHPVRDESHIQHNASGEVATV